jgi:glucokinase
MQKRDFKKMITVIAAAVSAVVLSATVYADTKADVLTFIENSQTVITAVIAITGAGIVFLGVVHLIESQQSQDPVARSGGIKQLAAGLGIIIIALILVPPLITMVKNQIN